MRIALLSLHTSPGAVPGSGDAGGLNVVVAEAARALARRGHDVSVFTRASSTHTSATGTSATDTPGERPLDADHPHGAQLITVAAGPTRLRKEDLPAVIDQFAHEVAAHAAQPLGFDAVHGHYWLSGIAALALTAAAGLPPAVTLHTVAAHKNTHLRHGETPEPAARLDGERRLTQHAFVVAGSRSELDGIVSGYGTPPHGSAIIAPGVDTERFRPAQHRTPGAPLRITVLGRVQPLKGQDLAIRAAAHVARRDPQLWSRSELIIAGEPTPGAEDYARSLRQLAHDLGIADRVRWLPAQDRQAAATLLADSSVVVVPSASETFGLVALEAAACGVPVVVGAHTGFLESAPDGVSGVHVTGRSAEEWGEAIHSLLRDPARRAQLGQRGRAFALAHNWDAHAAALERVYLRLRHR